MITWENYEEYMMMHADGELRPDEEKALMAFVNQHPELKKELAVYELTRLTPDTTQVFADKNSLLKPVPQKRTIAFPQWRRYSIAAGIAALIFVSLFEYLKPQTPEGASPQDVAKKTEKPQTNQNIAPPVVAKNEAPVQGNKPVAKQDTDVVNPVVRNDTRVAVVHKVNKEHKKQEVVKHTPQVMQDAVAISELSVAGAKQMPCNKAGIEIAEVKDIPVYAAVSSNDEVKRTFWDKLPIDDIKKKQLENIASAAANVYQGVNTAKEDLYDKSISIDVKVEKRKLIISF